MCLPDAQKIDKLISRILTLAEKVGVECEGNLALQRSIDQYLLIQKAVELKLMFEAFQMMRIDEHRIQIHYRQVYFRWREGVRMLHAHNLNSVRN